MLEVRSAGALTTVQDGLGRPGAAAVGVPRGGAADPDGLAVANLLLGNEPSAAALELTLIGPDLDVVTGCTVAIGGADLGAAIGGTGVTLAPGTAHRLDAGTRLTFGGPQPAGGVRGYLALPGGVDVPTVLGSASTCLPGRFGGLDGRPLAAGDRIRGRRAGGAVVTHAWPGLPATIPPDGVHRLRVTPGPHADERRLAALVAEPWEVSPHSSRAGVRLTGRTNEGGRGDLASFPVRWGAVQLPPSGEPIVLLVDGPTVGGYPVVAVVVSADRGALGQLGPADRVRFEVVSEAAARIAELERRRALAEVARALGSGLDGGVGAPGADRA